MESVDLLALTNPVWETTVLLAELPDPAEVQMRGIEPYAATALAVVRDGGGSAANTLCAAARAGLRCAVVGYAGDDEAGGAAVESLRKWGVLPLVTLLSGRATKRTAMVKQAGTDEGYFRLWEPGRTVPPPDPALVPPELVLGARVLHLDRVSEAAEPLVRARAEAGLPVSLDLHTCPHRPAAQDRLDALLPRLAVLQVSQAAARLLGAWRGLPDDPAGVAAALSRMVPWVAVTCGARGAVVAARGEDPRWIAAAQPPELVDSTGAGDAFAAALLGGFLGGWTLGESAEAAVVAGARACSMLGARG